MSAHPWIILFDIDGTLLTVKSDFSRPMIRSLLDQHQIDYPNMEKDSFSGRTDHDIFTSFLVNHDYDMEIYRQFKAAYLSRLREKLDEEKVIRHKHIDEALTYFSEDQFVTGLLTGNYPDAATYKLKAAKIHYNFSIGAFGEFDKDRNKLPYLAMEKVQKLMGIEPVSSKFVVIGDTPKDIICAKKAGMKSVAVTTGNYNYEELSKHNPELILDSLAKPERWFKKLVTG